MPSPSRKLPKGIILDFDGVLVDSLSLHIRAWEQACLEIFGKSIENSSHLRGKATHKIASEIINEVRALPDQAPLLVKRKQSILENSEFADIFYPGVLSEIARILAQGIPIGIASNAPTKFIHRVLEHSAVQFLAVVGRDDVQRGKPHPDPFLKCANMLNLDFSFHREIWALDDSPHGIKSIVAAKMLPIGICTEHSPSTLMAEGAAETFDQTVDFLRMILN